MREVHSSVYLDGRKIHRRYTEIYLSANAQQGFCKEIRRPGVNVFHLTLVLSERGATLPCFLLSPCLSRAHCHGRWSAHIVATSFLVLYCLRFPTDSLSLRFAAAHKKLKGIPCERIDSDPSLGLSNSFLSFF